MALLERCDKCQGRMFLEESDALVRQPDEVCVNCGWRRSALPPVDVSAEEEGDGRQRRQASHGSGDGRVRL